MRAVILENPGAPLKQTELPNPVPGPGQLKLTVKACGVCRTDLHLRDAEIPATKLPVVLGHQIVASLVRWFPTDRLRHRIWTTPVGRAP